ncbi:MAG: MFS transporter [Luteolibacter sp.]
MSGLGGLLYGIDIGIIDGALPFIKKGLQISEQQASFIVAAVLAGSAIASIVAGALADFLGRKLMMIISALMFIASVFVIKSADAYSTLLIGRLVQGASGGVIAVVIPLYLAECLPSAKRGRGTALFQLLLTVGILLAGVIGAGFINEAKSAMDAAKAAKDTAAELAAANHAWRSMFLIVLAPGALYLIGTGLVAESPRWLFRKGRTDAAKNALLKSRTPSEADVELSEMAVHNDGAAKTASGTSHQGSIFQRKYVVPFIIACIILGCTQGTGINSILQYLTLILQKGGFTLTDAAMYGNAVKVTNIVVTIIAMILVDKMGRKFLLKLGTAGIVVSLAMGAAAFLSFESKRVDVLDKVKAEFRDNAISVPVTVDKLGPAAADGTPMELNVLFGKVAIDPKTGQEHEVAEDTASAFSNDKEPILKLEGGQDNAGNTLKLVIKRATYGPIAPKAAGYAILGSLMLFIASFAVGPGVCVWLALSELMPTRIRSVGMGIALVINQGVSTTIAGAFLPSVGSHGYASFFIFCGISTVIYFITAAFFMPETKGKTLEEIEEYFEGKKKA